MIFYVLTLFPDSFKGFVESSILGKSISSGILSIELVNIRDFALDKHRTCDDHTYGGGPGMILKPEPISLALENIGVSGKRIIYLTPSGKLYKQEYAEELSREEEIVLLCGRYEGIDQRIIDHYVDDEISVGDYILSSGEVAAKVIIDSVSRLLPGVIKEESLIEESFKKGLLEYPQYTRPKKILGREVPDILFSGHHARIKEWRLQKSFEKTLKYRPELLDSIQLTNDEKKLLGKVITEGEGEGHGSVKSD